MLSNRQTLSPCYYIITGREKNRCNSPGYVIEKGIDKAEQMYGLDWTKEDKYKGNWFLVQTNWDRNIPDPKTDYRRVPLEHKIRNAGYKKMNYNLGWKFIREKPNWVPFGPQSSTLVTHIYEFDYSKIDALEKVMIKRE